MLPVVSVGSNRRGIGGLTGEWRRALRRVSPDEFGTTDLTACAVVVLLDTALEALEPRGTAEAARKGGAELWVVADGVPAATIVAWGRVDARLLVPEDLPEALLGLAQRQRRPNLPTETYAGVPEHRLGPEARRVLERIAVLPRIAVNDWAKDLGMTRHQLRRACLRLYGRNSTEILRDWLLVATNEVRAAGCTWADAATLFGYSQPSSLQRSIAAMSSPSGSMRAPEQVSVNESAGPIAPPRKSREL